jgi:hypothetical protein
MSKSGKSKGNKAMRRLAGDLSRLTILLVLLTWPGAMTLMGLKIDSGTISGVVRDGEGKGLAGASVTLTSHSATAGISHATTGPTGEYRFSGLADGEYAVGAEMVGYTTGGGRTVQVTPESNTATVDLVLLRSSAKAGSGVTASLDKH